MDIELFKISYIGWAQIKCKKLSNIIHAVRLLKELTQQKEKLYPGNDTWQFLFFFGQVVSCLNSYQQRKGCQHRLSLGRQELDTGARSVPSCYPLGGNPSQLDKGVWEGDGPTEVLINICMGGAQREHFTDMVCCTGGVVPLQGIIPSRVLLRVVPSHITL